MTRDSDGSGKIREREGCCDTRPKPCPYHEGWQDALETVSVLHAHPGIIHAHPGGALDHTHDYEAAYDYERARGLSSD